jgi:AMP phosphorylase
VLEQHKDRPLALEAKALRLAGKLLSLCFADTPGKKDLIGEEVAREMLVSGKALKKMQEIIKTQGGNSGVTSDMLHPAKYKYEVRSTKKGRVHAIDNKQITVVCRVLGCPTDKKAGMYLNRKLEEEVDKNDILCTLYSSDKWRLKETVETMKNVSVYKIE